MAQHFGVPAISTGSIFRDNVARKTALGQQVEAIMAAGEFVPDELTEQLVADRLSQPDAADGWLLDGFPPARCIRFRRCPITWPRAASSWMLLSRWRFLRLC